MFTYTTHFGHKLCPSLCLEIHGSRKIIAAFSIARNLDLPPSFSHNNNDRAELSTTSLTSFTRLLTTLTFLALLQVYIHYDNICIYATASLCLFSPVDLSLITSDPSSYSSFSVAAVTTADPAVVMVVDIIIIMMIIFIFIMMIFFKFLLSIICDYYCPPSAADNTMSSDWLNVTRSNPGMNHS